MSSIPVSCPMHRRRRRQRPNPSRRQCRLRALQL